VGAEVLLAQFIPFERDRNRRPIPRAHGVYGYGGLCIRIAIDIDKDATAALVLVLFQSVSGRVHGRRRLRDIPGEERTESKSCSRLRGTPTCKPREPVVLRNAGNSKSSSTVLSTRAASITAEKSSVEGSRSKII